MSKKQEDRAKKSDIAITKICVEADKMGLSYGQLQALKYEQQLNAKEEQEQLEKAAEESKKRKRGKNLRIIKPEGWELYARMIEGGSMSITQAAKELHVTRPTLYRWLEELKHQRQLWL